jgi:hypothetical protein
MVSPVHIGELLPAVTVIALPNSISTTSELVGQEGSFVIVHCKPNVPGAVVVAVEAQFKGSIIVSVNGPETCVQRPVPMAGWFAFNTVENPQTVCWFPATAMEGGG